MQVDCCFSATKMHETLNIEWLDITRKRHTCAEVYKLVNEKGPPNLVELFKPVQPTRALRSNRQVKLNRPKTKTKFADRDFVIRGMSYWDKIPWEVQTAPSLDSFKQNLKKNVHVFEHIT